MDTNYPYKKLEIFHVSKRLIKTIYKITTKFPKTELYNLTQQLKRAALSVSLNIVEGNSRYYKKEQAKFASHAISSLMEVDACIEIAVDLKYIKDGRELDKLHETIKELYFKLIAYSKSKFK